MQEAGVVGNVTTDKRKNQAVYAREEDNES